MRLLFLIGTPRQQVAEYLQVGAVISRVVRSEEARAELLAAQNEDELRAILPRPIKVAV